MKDVAVIGLGIAAAAPLYDEAEAIGYGEEDVGAVHAVLARRAGLVPAE